jgi:anti-sigma regulatory factor (Ser/Thr protein kinase)
MSSTAPKSEEGFAFQVNGGREAGGLARRAFVAGDGALPSEVRQDVLLLMTELVTNSVRHARVEADESLRVEVLQSPQRVRVAVVDPGRGFARAEPRFKSEGPGGLGLFLVDRIADRWGVSSEASGTRVWFEIEFKA